MKKLLAIASLLLAAGCVQDRNTIPVKSTPSSPTKTEMAITTSAVSDAMRDPESTRFRKWTAYQLSNGDRVVCGEVNAKNGFGAYVGYSPFYIRFRDGKPESVLTDWQASEGCHRAAQPEYKISS